MHGANEWQVDLRHRLANAIYPIARFDLTDDSAHEQTLAHLPPITRHPGLAVDGYADVLEAGEERRRTVEADFNVDRPAISCEATCERINVGLNAAEPAEHVGK